MSTNSRVVKASADQVWNVLSNRWLYPVFVVGATRMREVDEQWPEVTIEEDVVSGPSRLVPKPVRDLPLGWRNVETLRRLAFIAESRSG